MGRISTPVFHMRLIIFDIDGTLTDTTMIDAGCFVRALADVYGFTAVDIEWSRYTQVTDAGVFMEIFESRAGRRPCTEEISRFRERFVSLLASAQSACPFQPVNGARQLLAALADHREYRVALASGCWSESARMKMASAGMNYDAYPSASADDAAARPPIIQLAEQRAASRYGAFENSVYVGDGVWDARACRALGIPFIGVGRGGQAEKLLAAGAVHVFPDFADGDGFVQILGGVEA